MLLPYLVGLVFSSILKDSALLEVSRVPSFLDTKCLEPGTVFSDMPGLV